MNARLEHVLHVPQRELIVSERTKFSVAAQIGRQAVQQIGGQLHASLLVGRHPPLVQVQLHFQLNLVAIERRHVYQIAHRILQRIALGLGFIKRLLGFPHAHLTVVIAAQDRRQADDANNSGPFQPRLCKFPGTGFGGCPEDHECLTN